MSISTFRMLVPVDTLYVVKGPGLKRLQEVQDVYRYENGLHVTLTLKTDASTKTFTRTVRVWDFIRYDWNDEEGSSSFTFGINGMNLHCYYDYLTRKGEVLQTHLTED